MPRRVITSPTLPAPMRGGAFSAGTEAPAGHTIYVSGQVSIYPRCYKQAAGIPRSPDSRRRGHARSARVSPPGREDQPQRPAESLGRIIQRLRRVLRGRGGGASSAGERAIFLDDRRIDMGDEALGMLRHMRKQIFGNPAPYVEVRSAAISIGLDPAGSECRALVDELLRGGYLRRYPSSSLTAHGLYRLTDSGISAADEAALEEARRRRRLNEGREKS
jgi:hypothetical protein